MACKSGLISGKKAISECMIPLQAHVRCAAKPSKTLLTAHIMLLGKYDLGFVAAERTKLCVQEQSLKVVVETMSTW